MPTVWHHWTDPASITRWAFTSDDWECPYATNNVCVGGRFLTRMSAKDGSASFDFTGLYTEVDTYRTIKYLMDKEPDAPMHRGCAIQFIQNEDDTVTIQETFTPEAQNSRELQEQGWTAILLNFKKFVEGEGK